MSSGITRERPTPRPVSCISLDDPEVAAGFGALESLLRRGLGDTSSAVVSEAGLLTLAASSERLLAALPAPGPPLSLFTAAVRHQTDVWKDGGLAAGALLAGLLSRLLHVAAPRHRLRDALRMVAAECRRAASDQQLRLRLEVPQLLGVVSTVLRSKRLPGMTASERRHLALQLLRAFLLVVPTETVDNRASLGHVHLQMVESGDVLDSAPVPALLLPEPALDDSPLPRFTGPGPRRCLLLTPHLGSHDEALDDVDVSLSATLSARPLSAERWQAALAPLPLRPGDVLACQRTVAPQLRRWLAGRGVVVLERLGSRGTALLSRLSGARALSGASLLSEVATELTEDEPGRSSEMVGRLDALAVRRIEGRAYAELSRAGAPVVTLLVHFAQPEPLRQELERQLESALFALCCLLGEPAVVPGGGCLETALIGRLRPYGSGQDQVTRDVTAALCDVLRQNALGIARQSILYSDDTYRHAWKTEPTGAAADDTCVCGLVSASDLRGRLRFAELTPSYFCEGGAGREPGPAPVPIDPAEVAEETLVDCGRVKIGGLASALEACHAILGIGTCVVEKKRKA